MNANTREFTRYLSAATLAAAAVAGLFLVATAYFDQKLNGKIDHPDADESMISQTCIDDPSCNNPTILIKLAQAMAGGNESERQLSRALLARAIRNDELRPLAWALMSYLDAKDAGRMTPSAISALKRSVEICRLCDNQELLRWRLEFVLRHWTTVPEELRLAAIEGADVLRWRYEDDEFLTAQEDYALSHNVPLLAYSETLESPEFLDLRSP